MPATITQNPNFPNQSSPNGKQAYVQQLSYRQMINEVCQWNPNVDPMIAGRWLNSYYRDLLQKRNWYALKVRGNINVPQTINTGRATATNGSNIIQGTGTAWTRNLIGMQFRVGFTYPYQTIYDVDVSNQRLTVDSQFGGNTITGGYNIVEAYVQMGANAVRLLHAKNQQQGWSMDVDVPQQVLDGRDAWRISLGWSKVISPRPPSVDGIYQMEIWPTPYSQQVFPYEGYIQPPDMVLDTDSPASFIRADILVTRAISDAKLFGGRGDKYYDPTVAQMKIAQYNASVELMENADNALDQQDVTWEYEHDGAGFSEGSIYGQSHDI
jgi:hypothetical protein